METGNRSQYEKSERASTGEQQADMETFHIRQTSKDKSIEKKSNKEKHHEKNDKQSIDERIQQATEEKIIE